MAEICHSSGGSGSPSRVTTCEEISAGILANSLKPRTHSLGTPKILANQFGPRTDWHRNRGLTSSDERIARV